MRTRWRPSLRTGRRSISPKTDLKQLHRGLLKHPTGDERHRGEYKTLPNHVEAFGRDGRSLGVVFQTATPFETPARMAELAAWTRARMEGNELHPLLVVAVFVVTFLEIHPFQDGNGRLSRITSRPSAVACGPGYAYAPYSSLESVIEQSKDAYYLALRRTQGTMRTDAPDWQPWVVWFLKALQLHKDRLAVKIERERLVAGALPDLSIRILDVAREHGRVSVGAAVRLTGANRNTVKDHLKTLVEKGHLTRRGAGRGAWYAPS